MITISVYAQLPGVRSFPAVHVKTKNGFLVTHDRLPRYEPTPPSKRPSSSWVWDHGKQIRLIKGSVKCWMCRICYNDSVYHPLAKYVLPAKPTTLAQRHMDLNGYDLNGKLILTVKRYFADTGGSVSKQHRAINTPCNREAWQRASVRWTVSTN